MSSKMTLIKKLSSRGVLASVALVSLSACMSQPDVSDQIYRCSDQFDVVVSERSETKVHVEMLGKYYVLNRMASASGEKFKSHDEQVKMWFKGEQASIKNSGYPIQMCHLVVPMNNIDAPSNDTMF